MTPANYKITRELLQTKAKPDAILLHSLPRMDEIPPDVDITTLVALLAGGLQRRRHAHGAAGPRPGRDGVGRSNANQSPQGRDLIGDLDSPRRRWRPYWTWPLT